jgi:hypothetical protein
MTLRSRNPWLSGMLGVCLLALAACNDTNPTNPQPADESSRDQPAAVVRWPYTNLVAARLSPTPLTTTVATAD